MTDVPSPHPTATGLRREDARLVTGRSRFVANHRPDGLLHCAFARASVAHGRLESVTLDTARDAPGVVAAYAAADLDLPDIPGSTGRGPAAPQMARPVLARERVRYAGEPVAAVIAVSAYAAADARDLVDFDIEPLGVVADPEAACRDTTLLFPGAGSNVVDRSVVGERPTLDGWPVSASVEVDSPRLAPLPLEPLSVLAEPHPDGRLTLRCGHQAPHRLRAQLAGLLCIDPARLRVVVPDVGGGFGLKGMLFPEYVVVAAVALRLGCPVLWTETRSEQFLGGTHGRGMRHRVELAGETSGRIRAARVTILADLGAYPHNGSHVPLFARYMALGPYDVQDAEITATMVVTNRAPVGSYRGAGRPEAAYAIERAVEAFAREVGMDSVEVRRRNLIRPGDMPYRTVTGALYDSGDYPRALELALELIGVEQLRKEQTRRREEGRNPIGLGVAPFVERAGGAKDSTEYARVEIAAGGSLTTRVGTAATGQGHETVWAQLVADAFDADAADVEVVTGDTDAVRDGVGSFASRSAQVGGSAVHRMAYEVRARCLELAAEVLEVAPDDLHLVAGRFHVAGDETAGLGLAELSAVAAQRGIELAAEESYSPHAQTFPYGCTAAAVEVDLETGKIGLQRIVAVDDCGNVLNPLVVEGQVHGSTAQGVAQALYEGIEYGEDGQLLTSTLADYLTPTAPDLPPFETARLVTPAPSNPLGVKGAGESGCIGAPPAVVNAALDALAPYGITDLQMPLTPEKVWRALHETKRREQQT